jgi:cytochrome c oxidase subunit 2
MSTSLRVIAAAGTLTGVLTMTGCAGGSVVASISGAELYEACAPCHGAAGEGNAALRAPAIAGLPASYVSTQLKRFQTGVRGRHAADAEGLRMQAMARQLYSDTETTAVALHVASLPRVANAATIGGSDAAAGQRAFLICAGCHGADGRGNEAVSVPPLAGVDDWYVAAQVRKFKNGVRGTTPGDAFGPVMRAVAGRLSAEDISQIATYLHSLPGERDALQ